jgi:WD40 repeat protein
MANQLNGDIYVTGEDKLLKKYQYPTENIDSIDWKRAPPAPEEEHLSHSIGTTCWDIAKDFKFMATGGRDGQLFLRHVENVGQNPSPIKAQAIYSGGVTALCLSKTRTTLYSAGGAGSFMAWTIGGKPLPPAPVNCTYSSTGALAKMPEL